MFKLRDANPPPQETILWLEDDGLNINLKARVMPGGAPHTVIRIRKAAGAVWLPDGLPTDLGFTLTRNGQLNVVRNHEA